jgi:glycosyltransferase involved in cell wall biosynthesis
MKNSFKILERNNLFYNFFLNRKILEVKGELSEEELVKRVMYLAEFAWRNHSGYYSDGRLENVLFDLGTNLNRYIDEKRVDNDIKRLFAGKNDYSILHVATELGEVGGHTRILCQFLKRHEESNQIVILTNQSIKNVPQWFINDIGNIPIVTLDSISSLFERAYILRYISNFSKRIILYHHPYDAVPIMAFSHDTCPPVLIENHAHSWFWLGPSIADMVLAHTNFHKNFTRKTRPVDNVYFLPFTQLDDIDGAFDQKDKVTAKEKLNISPNAICIITIGTAEKFIPNSQYNFYKTAKKIVERFENVELFVIGTSYNKKYNLNTQRVHFLGPVSDPSEYYKAADICLDALPQPSLGGTMYSTLIGMACPLLKYGVFNVFNSRNFGVAKLYERHIGTVRNEKEYLKKLEFLINNPDIRFQIAKEIREDYIRLSSKDSIAKNINEMLKHANDLEHLPGRIPDGFYSCDADSAEIADTSSLQDLFSIFRYFERYLTMKDKITIVSRLLTKFIYCMDILKLAGISLKNTVKTLYLVLFRDRRFLWSD